MLVIGLTGGIGSGKTTVANLFAKKGITVIDTDQLARDVTDPQHPALTKIAEKFGKDILLTDGNLNRTLLRKKVFEHADDRIWLEKLLHPLIRDKIKEQLKTSHSPYAIVVIPLLFETEANPMINRILVVDSSESQQIQRTMARDHLSSAETINAILKTQVPREKRLDGADDIIQNTGTLDELAAQVDQMHEFYLKKCGTS